MQSAIKNFVAAWNEHRISGSSGGIPNVSARRANQIIRFDSANVPETPIAVTASWAKWASVDQRERPNPLARYTQLSVLREWNFTARHPNIEDIMQYVLFHPFKLAITDLIKLTKSYSRVIGYWTEQQCVICVIVCALLVMKNVTVGRKEGGRVLRRYLWRPKG